MKLIPYDLYREKFDLDIFSNQYLPLMEKLENLYGHSELNITAFYNILELGNPKGKTILDLGCGAVNSLDHYFKERLFEPWLARGLHELGAKVIGIDLGDLDKEKFTGYKVDLTKQNSLSFLKNDSIDIAIASSFFDSPALQYSNSGEETFNTLLPQLERIVKPNGYFIFDRLNTGY